ncbi:protein SprT [Lysinibacillus sp. PLM2]|nr:protein SprT [Lysinibacillus sp. PLM2]
MTDHELQTIVEELSIKYFNRPFIHKAYFNNRLRTTGGRYLLNNHNIEFNKRSYDIFGIDELRGIILHELCHYHLHIQGRGYKHRDSDFRNLLKQVGAPRFCSTIEENKIKRKTSIRRIYECIDCKQQYPRKRKVDVNKYRCSKCYGKLREINYKLNE